MGLDLTLGVEKWRSLTDCLAYDRLSFDRDYELFECIKDCGRSEPIERFCEPKVCNFQVRWYEDEGVEVVTRDAYGEELTYVTAGELSQIPLRICTWGQVDYNKAMLCFIKALPSDTRIILWWH